MSCGKWNVKSKELLRRHVDSVRISCGKCWQRLLSAACIRVQGSEVNRDRTIIVKVDCENLLRVVRLEPRIIHDDPFLELLTRQRCLITLVCEAIGQSIGRCYDQNASDCNCGEYDQKGPDRLGYSTGSLIPFTQRKLVSLTCSNYI